MPAPSSFPSLLRPRGSVRVPVAVLGVAQALVLVGGLTAATRLGPQELTVLVVLDAADSRAEGAACVGTGAFADVREGAVVRVGDHRQSPVGTARLGAGASQGPGCRFLAVVPLEHESELYGITVGEQGGKVVSRPDDGAVLLEYGVPTP